MIKLKVTFRSLAKGVEVMEWSVTPENSKSVADTINYIMGGQLPKKIVKVEMIDASGVTIK